jgi:large subunit ribosomal protein L23
VRFAVVNQNAKAAQCASKSFRGQLGKRKDVKKAYVTLEEGNTIDVSTGL